MSDNDGGDRIGLDTDELPRAKDAVRYIADSRILERIAKLARESGSLVRDPSLPIRAGELPNHVEPSDWRAGYLSVHDYEPPPELYADLKQCAPQALLRDLFRPEFEAFVWHDRETLVTFDRGGTQALKDALAAQKLDPVPHVEPLIAEVTRHAASWHQLMVERWKPILDDSEPRKRVHTFHEPSLNV